MMRYRNYTIEREHPPIPGVWYSYVHDDYDGAPEYSYGPPADNRSGFARSIDEAKEAIDELEDE